ncbi:MAG: tetraspanin family protein [Propionibacteriaceae bacterium]|jgi:hypothetical protein|nr:tetraspanin family protein [Propionibacteriaceae bacterium]
MSEPTSPRGNHISIGDNAQGNVVVGGDNSGVIALVPPVDRPEPHRFHVEKRRVTPITDQTMLALNWIMTICGLASLGIAGLQAYNQVNAHGVLAISIEVSQFIYVLFGVGVIVLFLAFFGWVFRKWLKRHIYGNSLVFGRVPEGRIDSRGRYHLCLTRIRGVCAIDGEAMKVRRIPTRATLFTLPDGSTRTKYSNYELRLVCSRNPMDASHQAKIDLSDTED